MKQLSLSLTLKFYCFLAIHIVGPEVEMGKKCHFPLGSLNIPISCWNLQTKFPIGKLYFPRSENFCIEKWVIRIGKLILPNQVGNREFPWSEWFSLEYWKFQVGNSSFANKLNYEWNNNHSIRKVCYSKLGKISSGYWIFRVGKLTFPTQLKK